MEESSGNRTGNEEARAESERDGGHSSSNSAHRADTDADDNADSGNDVGQLNPVTSNPLDEFMPEEEDDDAIDIGQLNAPPPDPLPVDEHRGRWEKKPRESSHTSGSLEMAREMAEAGWDERNRRKKKFPIMRLGILVAIALCAGGGWYAYKRWPQTTVQSPPPQAEPPPTTKVEPAPDLNAHVVQLDEAGQVASELPIKREDSEKKLAEYAKGIVDPNMELLEEAEKSDAEVRKQMDELKKNLGVEGQRTEQKIRATIETNRKRAAQIKALNDILIRRHEAEPASRPRATTPVPARQRQSKVPPVTSLDDLTTPDLEALLAKLTQEDASLADTPVPLPRLPVARDKPKQRQPTSVSKGEVPSNYVYRAPAPRRIEKPQPAKYPAWLLTPREKECLRDKKLC